MTTENAAAETTTNDATTTETVVEKEVTIDDVYRDAGLDKLATDDAPAKETQVTTKVETRVDPLNVPDPYDSEKFKEFIAGQGARTTELTQTVRALAQHMTAEAQAKAIAATKADIESAVKAVNEVVGHPKPKVIEAAIDGMVRENPRLKAIWDNRAKNPTAWKNVIPILSKQIAEDFSVKVDPALVNAQRARKDSQKQMATTSRDSDENAIEDRMGKAQGADFDLSWQQLISGGH